MNRIDLGILIALLAALAFVIAMVARASFASDVTQAEIRRAST